MPSAVRHSISSAEANRLMRARYCALLAARKVAFASIFTSMPTRVTVHLRPSRSATLEDSAAIFASLLRLCAPHSRRRRAAGANPRFPILYLSGADSVRRPNASRCIEEKFSEWVAHHVAYLAMGGISVNRFFFIDGDLVEPRASGAERLTRMKHRLGILLAANLDDRKVVPPQPRNPRNLSEL